MALAVLLVMVPLINSLPKFRLVFASEVKRAPSSVKASQKALWVIKLSFLFKLTRRVDCENPHQTIYFQKGARTTKFVNHPTRNWVPYFAANLVSGNHSLAMYRS